MRIRTLVQLCLACLAIFLVIAGCARIGGPADIARRIRTEIKSVRPHPDAVPTPLLIENTRPVTFTLSLPAAPTSETIASQAVRPPGDVAPVQSIETGRTSTEAETAIPGATSVPTATPAYVAAQPAMALSNFTHMWQTWNNCGPATLAMNLSYFGSNLSQADVAAMLRPDEDDKNVSPHEMVAYARAQGYNARMQVSGTPEELRLLLSNGIPAIIETWHVPEPNNGMGHYRLLTGYDDAAQEWIAYDTYDTENLVNPAGDYQGIKIPYGEMDELWRVFNRVYVIVYTDQLAPVVEGILGPRMDDTVMWQQSVLRAQAETRHQPDDAFAWFNLGSGLVALGLFEEAAAAYDHARQLGLPWRMLWYQFGPLQAYYEVGRFDEVLTLADITLRHVTHVEELHYWRGLALEARGDVVAAQRAFQKAVQLNVNYVDAVDALASVANR